MMTRSLLHTLQALSRTSKPGPPTVYSHVHLCLALLTIGDQGPIGRIELSRKLAIGEGAVRTIIKRLAQAGLLATAKEGCVLTNQGSSLYQQLRRKFSNIIILDAKQLSIDKVNAAVLIRSARHLVKKGIEQRDAAVRAGATGACTLVCSHGKFTMPLDDEPQWKLTPRDSLFQELNSSLQPKDNDVIAIIGAAGKEQAKQGAMAAALTLLQ